MIMTGINGKNDSKHQQSNVIVLFDSTSDIDQLKDLVKQKKNLVIITFDYESHKTMLQNKIQHQISDDYLKENDLQMIQNSSYAISEWFNKPEIADLLDYDGINLGQLYQVEFHYLIVPFLKKFVELIKIFDKYREDNYLASKTLYNMILTFTISTTKFKNDYENSNEFLYDSVKIPLKIGNRSTRISLSRSSYLKLKQVSEKIIHILFQPKQHFSNNKSILLVEFDPTRYDRIFSLMTKTLLKFIFFNRRRPAIWNYKSFSIMRKSGCSIITDSEIVDDYLKNSIKNNILRFQQKIESLSNQQNFFKSFFLINGYSFWEILKPAFMELTKKRIHEAIQEIDLTKRLLEKYKFSSILVWSEIGFNEQIMIKLAKRINIPVVLIQHGLYYDTSQAYEFNKLAGIFPFNSSKFVVWGKVLRQYAVDVGILPEKIEILGSPLHDKIFERKLENSNLQNDFILLATSSPVNNLVNDLTVKTREKYEETIKKICQIVSKMDKKLVIKLHPFSEELDITKLAKEIDPKITVIKAGDFLSLVQSCEIFITIDLSTTILEAQILKKPVISISVKDYGFGEPEVFRSNSCIRTDIDNFESILNQMLSDPNFRQSVIENGDKFIDNYFSNQGKAAEELLSFLKKL